MLRLVVIAVFAHIGIASDVALATTEAAPRSFAGFAALQQHVTPRIRTRRENDHHGVYAECDDLKACTAAVGEVSVASMEFRNRSDLQIACLTKGVESQYADACAAWRKCLTIGPSAVIPVDSFHTYIRQKEASVNAAGAIASTAYTSLGVQVEGPTIGQNYSLITHISNASGLIREWNDATGYTLRVGDMITAVNGSGSALRPYLAHRIPRLTAVNITVRRDVTEAILDILYASREDQLEKQPILSGAQLEKGELVQRDGGTQASGDCLHPSVEDPEFLLCDCFTGMQRKCHAPGVHDVANYTDADCFRALFCMMDRVCEPWKAQSCDADQTKMLMAGIIQGALREHVIQ